MGFKIKYKLRQSSAGSGGDTPPPSTPPSPLPASPPSPLPPPPPADEDEDWEEEQNEPARSYDSKFSCLLMSVQRNIPHYIHRDDCEPLRKRKYFSLHSKWRQLLAGKRTYLRSLMDNCLLNYNYDDFHFQCPEPLLRTLGCQEPLSVLICEYQKNRIILQKIKILSQHYVLLRRTRRDGNCFYRAFFFSYLENLGQMQDNQAEVTRLMECVAKSGENFCCLKWGRAYFLNPEAYFSSVVSEFKGLVNSVANGLSADDLYRRSLQEIMSFRILSLLRLLTEIEILTREDDYKSFFPQQKSAFECCLKAVRPLDIDAIGLQMRALSYALGIPLRIELLDTSLKARVVQVKRLDLFPRSESGVNTTSGPLHTIESYVVSSTTAKPPEQGRDSNSIKQAEVRTNGNLLSSGGTPLVTLLCRPGQCHILYSK